MISDRLAKSLSKVASKSFTRMHDPDKVTIQRIFIDNWDDFQKDSEVIHRGLRSVVIKEVDRMMKCGQLESGFEIYECPNCHKTHHRLHLQEQIL